MKKITVEHSSGSYPAIFSQGAFLRLNKFIKQIPPTDKIFFIIDRNVFRLHKELISKVLPDFEITTPFLVPPGESSKSYRLLKTIHGEMLQKGYSRNSLVIAIGGGVTGDLSGFAAASFMRGIRLLHIPTTIIAAADSSIGGKTGINLDGIKNVIGAFHQPEMVIIDPVFFETLPAEIYHSGLGEIIKYAYLSGQDQVNNLKHNFERLLQKDPAYLEEVILECVKFKAAVTARDEKEQGLRKILNFGHTFAHGFESASGFKLSHGIAVHGGIIAAIILSTRLGLIPTGKRDQILELALKLRPSRLLGKLSPDKIYRAMLKDKKNRIGELRFVLLREPGSILPEISAPKNQVVSSIKDLQNLV